MDLPMQIAVVLEGGMVQSTHVANLPEGQDPPDILVIDYDTEGASEEDITTFEIDGDDHQAICSTHIPEISTEKTGLPIQKIIDYLASESE